MTERIEFTNGYFMNGEEGIRIATTKEFALNLEKFNVNDFIYILDMDESEICKFTVVRTLAGGRWIKESTEFEPEIIFLDNSTDRYVLKNDEYILENPAIVKLAEELKEIKELLYAMQFMPGMPAVEQAKKRFEENSKSAKSAKGLE